MPSTHLSLHYHLVFSTRDRTPYIIPAWRPRLYEYIAGTIRGIDAVPECVGGTADHIHLLVGLKATHCLADFVRELKKSSSIWIRREIGVAQFGWQKGYAVFSVSEARRNAVRMYILHQERHHHVRSFSEELVEMLERSGVEYDPRYLD